MAESRARFTQGTSEHTTRIITKKAVDPKPGMQGMPGFIRTGQDASSGGLASTKGSGPHREGPIGQKRPAGPLYADNQKFRGSSDKSYRATSTGPGGSVKRDTDIGSRGSSRTGGSEREGPQRGKPTRGAPQYGGTASAPGGHRGRMESMKGRARTSWEK
jgi:hypothetical protein